MSKLTIPTGALAVSTFGEWTLYELPQYETSSFLWQRFKLMLPPGTRPRWHCRRGYWLMWGLREARLARGREAAALAAEHPEMYEQVVLELGISYPRSWLIAKGGETEESIAAEVSRLALRKQLWTARQAAARRNGESL